MVTKTSKPYSIIVSSQKGGVGKTTISVNLATAIRQHGYKTLLIDADYSNPCVGLHLGMGSANAGLRAVIAGKAKLIDVVAVHNPTGLHVLVNEMTSRNFNPSISQQQILRKELVKSGYDFVIIDMPPGAENIEGVKEFCDENSRSAFLVLTPEMAACASAIRMAQICEKHHINHSMLANKVRNRRYELRMDEIEEAIGEGLIGVIPDDENVPISIAQHIPVVLLNGSCDFSRSIKNISRKVCSRVGYEPGGDMGIGMRMRSGGGLFGWIRWLLFGER